MTKRRTAASLVLPILAPCVALAAGIGGGDSGPPKPTETTTDCTEGKVWSEEAKACVDPQSGALDPDALYQAVRELAYAGRYPDALRALAAMPDQADDRVLTYRGFILRKMGDVELGNRYYLQAIAANPDNILARSYMGQGFVAQGDLVAARDQLLEIRARGGTGTWPEISLRRALETGAGFSY